MRIVPSHATSGNDVALHQPVEGGRACPVPSDLIAVRGPWGNRRPRRQLGSTGIVSADVIVRA
ncbi:hypothetical protein [Saccharopolyspora phatthalungensis]|uniref:Uncharacterized protein n=1 Tax=Saccharopolyspora phatthalungensis TaxID=664693 RepID=A0A840PW95_9PSEU|nr:hypothetical protein [Saccharopolyspora phatthalungensis]MBB5152596.1 hypothetical protein [Saccharopolyspora phatthalungensis]